MATIERMRRGIAGVSAMLVVAALALAVALWWSFARANAPDAPQDQPSDVTTVVTNP